MYILIVLLLGDNQVDYERKKNVRITDDNISSLLVFNICYISRHVAELDKNSNCSCDINFFFLKIFM